MDLGQTCEAASRLVVGERQEMYGDPVVFFERVARISRQLIGLAVTPRDLVLIMIAVKLARESHAHSDDNLVDICGYADILNSFPGLKGGG